MNSKTNPLNMQKILLNDRYGLTQAVLEGRKTVTRRIISAKTIENILEDFKQEYFEATLDVLKSDKEYIEQYFLIENRGKCFRRGEIVAVVQNLRDMGYDPKAKDWKRGNIWGLDHTVAWTNKTFVRASECIHQIRITNVRVERLQDISAEDCLREGIVKACGLYGCEGVCEMGDQLFFSNPRQAFAALIDKVSGKGTWDSNPYVFVYEFELVK